MLWAAAVGPLLMCWPRTWQGKAWWRLLLLGLLGLWSIGLLQMLHKGLHGVRNSWVVPAMSKWDVHVALGLRLGGWQPCGAHFATCEHQQTAV